MDAAGAAAGFCLEDYEGGAPRWCPGCGDLAVLNALQRYVRDEQLPPEKIAVISGIGCSSRLPHYVKAYGFHGLHGRAFPVACGVRSRRPDLHIFVATGDGDCCAIGTAHWIHAIRYNMNMTIMLLDNNIYGLTKMQSSPTTGKGHYSNTHPGGAPLTPINPLMTTLSITNASFVAQTVDWNPPHLYATLAAAHKHRGTSFVRVLQRCPHFMSGYFDEMQKDPMLVRLLTHDKGIAIDDAVKKAFPNRAEHDPSDLAAALSFAGDPEAHPVGLLYSNEQAEHYDDFTAQGLGTDAKAKVAAIEKELDRFTI
ncbi:MAG: thiamine pyrophosphate-dependent enzyme [Deltaproteobacteria bacterium]|nr:thiamine pyrophosphate-dependent enzyme [Deltaproteobacteria bacterium]